MHEDKCCIGEIFLLVVRGRKDYCGNGFWGTTISYSGWTPFGYVSILDIFAGVLHALVDVAAHIISFLPDGTCSINLYFTCDPPDASLIVRREDVATISVTPKCNSRLRIHVLSWAPKESLKISINSKTITPQWDSNWIVFDSAHISVGQTIRI